MRNTTWANRAVYERLADGTSTVPDAGHFIRVNDMDGRRAQTEVRRDTGSFPHDSDEEMMKDTGIIAITSVTSKVAFRRDTIIQEGKAVQRTSNLGSLQNLTGHKAQ